MEDGFSRIRNTHDQGASGPGVSYRLSGVNLVPVGIFAVPSGDEVNKRTGAFW